VNLLAGSASPYLAAAADQPVRWHPWGAEAFARARAEDRPVLLDVGAAWCHWCHVMDRESYEDPALAEFLNASFVCVKVDRDERPDVDARYQRAIQALAGQGGWPLTAVLTPDGDAFYGGTYFPPEARWGRPSFRDVLGRVLAVWRDQRAQVANQAAAVRRVVAESLAESREGEPAEAVLAEAEARIVAAFDPRHGGFGNQPKFPHPTALLFLLNRAAGSGSGGLREVIGRTLDAMASGGIHDQLGGGFHRYSVDERWVVPHFEKMAADNAELLRSYSEGWTAFREPEWEATARGVMRWVREVLEDPAGGYGASQDADVGLDDDGDYFTWTRAEAAAVLEPAELAVAGDRWDIGTAGEMSHDPSRNVLFVAAAEEAIAFRAELPVERVRDLLGSAAAKLHAARAARPTPAVDRTRYAAWNGMVAGAMLRAGAPPSCPGCARWRGCGRRRRRSTPWRTPPVVRPTCWTTRCRWRPPHSTPSRSRGTRPGSRGRRRSSTASGASFARPTGVRSSTGPAAARASWPPPGGRCRTTPPRRRTAWPGWRLPASPH
jgi:hypothetical protein